MLEFRNFKELVKKTRTAHIFDPKCSISRDDLEEVIETSLMAPNHKLTYPWRILKVSPEKREKIALIAQSLAAKKGKDPELQEKSRIKALSASELLVFVLNKKPGNTFEEREDYATLSCTIQLIALGLQTKGFHYKWSTGAISQSKETYDLLKVEEEIEEIIGFIWIGKALSEPKLRERPKYEEVIVNI